MKRSALRHDLIPVVVSDEREQLMPNVGMVELEDAESGRRTILDTSRKRVRNRFAEYAREQSASRDRIFRKMRLDPIEVQTGDSFADELTKYFERRERRQRR